MLSKLFRYEMRYSSPILLFLHGFLLLGALVLFGIRHLPESLPVSVITAVGSIFCILLAACTAFYTYLNIGIRFYRTVFSRQGYLTNTLPVSAGQLLLSRFLTAVLWGILDFLVVLVILCLLSGENIPAIFLSSLGQDPQLTRFFLLILFLLPASFLLIITAILCSVAVGNLFTGHRVIGSVVSFFGLQMLSQLVSLIPLLFVLKPLLTLPSGSYGAEEMMNSFPDAFFALQSMLLAEIFLYLLLAGALYLLTWHLLDKKLNLE